MRKALVKTMATLAATLTMGVMFSSPATAGSDAAVYGKSKCAHGVFEDRGERFFLRDNCGDGHSAVLLVDVDPIGGGGHYDFALWNSRGEDKTRRWNRSYAEGKTVCVRAAFGSASNGNIWGRGDWDCGVA